MDAIIRQAASETTLHNAAERILKGGIIAYPTETLYGLGARYDDESALARLYDLKQRPRAKTMPLIIGDRRALELLTSDLSDAALRIIEAFWPGPLTIIFRPGKSLSGFITSDTGVAVRMPGESFALRLAREVGLPITSTSANVSGLPPARDAATVAAYFGSGLDLIVDGGKSPGDAPSTIIDVTGDKVRLLREGPVGLSGILAAAALRPR
jgi:L-threonylcarbamoyladenylate synthase